jgi:hypothetical protein
MGMGTSDNKCSNSKSIYGEKVGWDFDLNLPWDEGSPLLWTLGIFHHSYSYSALSTGPTNFQGWAVY